MKIICNGGPNNKRIVESVEIEISGTTGEGAGVEFTVRGYFDLPGYAYNRPVLHRFHVLGRGWTLDAALLAMKQYVMGLEDSSPRQPHGA